MKRLLFFTLCIGLALTANAQSELMLPFLRNVFQSSYINPTVIPEHTVSIGLPGISSVHAQFIEDGFVPKNFMEYNKAEDSMHINPNNFLNDLDDRNLIYVGENVDIFHLRFKSANGYYWFGVRQNSTISFFFPKDLFALGIEGNEPYAGGIMDFSNLKLDVSLYNEYSIGMSKELPRWVFGGRISLLQGLSNVHFDPKSFNVAIDTGTYSHVIETDVQVQTSRIPKNKDGDPSFDHVDDINWITDYLTNFNNKGFALSGGVTYKYDEKTRLSFSFYDLGFISWKDSIETYTIKGKPNFNGLDMVSSWLYNGGDVDVDSLIDDIKDDFTRDTIRSSYRTWLNPKFVLSASYDITHRTTIGFSASGVYNKQLYPAFTVGLQQGIGRFFNVIATMSANHKTIKNLGVGLVIKPGPFQFYVIADNVYPLIDPLCFTNVNVRAGINLVFGRVKPADGLPYK